ncbi:hypothetical protein AURDEDRAFT_171544 [Auricularia subglabra TFB-10046 SS5]|nr:hypothetical protein AURDEDRAFT_171544 [Auricularia subglabra TFB-10046 SS5]
MVLDATGRRRHRPVSHNSKADFEQSCPYGDAGDPVARLLAGEAAVRDDGDVHSSHTERSELLVESHAVCEIEGPKHVQDALEYVLTDEVPVIASDRDVTVVRDGSRVVQGARDVCGDGELPMARDAGDESASQAGVEGRWENPDAAAGNGLALPPATTVEVLIRAVCNMLNYFTVEWVSVVDLADPAQQAAVRKFLAVSIFTSPLWLLPAAIIASLLGSYYFIPCTVACIGLLTVIYHTFRLHKCPTAT